MTACSRAVVNSAVKLISVSERFHIPILSDAVDVDDVICLSNGYLGRVRREGERCHLVGLLAKLPLQREV